MFKKLLQVIFLLSISIIKIYGQQIKIYPTHWWTGMKWNKVQLLIHADQRLSDKKIKINYPGVVIDHVHYFENEKYAAVDISIAPAARPGKVKLTIGENRSSKTIEWLLKPRRTGNGKTYAQGIRSQDLIYLLMPDRFSNGDPSNDRLPGLRDQSLDRDSIFLRHGGDLKGIIDHLDYLQGLGVTALWMTPVLQNDMFNRTEHGYAITDHYTVESRFGGNEYYLKLSDELHKRGMKLIQDAVYNHMGLYHFLMQDPPSKDWVHQWPVFTKPNYKEQTQFDPYAAASDKKIMEEGWFTEEMPDFNQHNPYVAAFLIQHALWCVEEFGVDAWRIDTYIYVDMPFMNRCNKALLNEYPRMTMAGESWVDATANQAYFRTNNFETAFKSNLPGSIDFQMLFHGILPAVMQPETGVNQLYQTLSNDFLYKDPASNIIFLDNHDISRFFSETGENVKKQKMGIQWLLTERGIPQMYYGTEILMKGIKNPDGWVRLDFPGGWTGDRKNAFTGEGLNADELSVQELTRKLGNFRKKSSALTTGKLMHYVPRDGLYVYFRYNKSQTIMCIMNTSTATRPVDFSAYAERTKGFAGAVNIISGEALKSSESHDIEAGDMWVLEMQN